MAPFKPPENLSVWAGTMAALSGLWFAMSGQSEKRIRQLAIIAAEDSGKFVLQAAQTIINDRLQDDVSDIKATVSDIHHLLLRGVAYDRDKPQE